MQADPGKDGLAQTPTRFPRWSFCTRAEESMICEAMHPNCSAKRIAEWGIDSLFPQRPETGFAGGLYVDPRKQGASGALQPPFIHVRYILWWEPSRRNSGGRSGNWVNLTLWKLRSTANDNPKANIQGNLDCHSLDRQIDSCPDIGPIIRSLLASAVSASCI